MEQYEYFGVSSLSVNVDRVYIAGYYDSFCVAESQNMNQPNANLLDADNVANGNYDIFLVELPTASSVFSTFQTYGTVETEFEEGYVSQSGGYTSFSSRSEGNIMLGFFTLPTPGGFLGSFEKGPMPSSP